MPQTPAAGAKVEPANQRTQVFFGNLTKKRPKAGGGTDSTPRPYIATCRKAIADLLNLPVPTMEQLEVTKDGKTISYSGARMAKTIRVPHPTSAKTPKGAIQQLSIQVPTNSNIKEIREFLKKSGKVEKFTIAGGRTYTVPK